MSAGVADSMSSTKPTLASRRDKGKDHFVKKDIHPVTNPVCFVDVSSGKKFICRSTAQSKKTENIDGVDHHMIVRDVTMDSHPAYTGEKRFVDTAGRVEKFQSKVSRRN